MAATPEQQLAALQNQVATLAGQQEALQNMLIQARTETQTEQAKTVAMQTQIGQLQAQLAAAPAMALELQQLKQQLAAMPAAAASGPERARA